MLDIKFIRENKKEIESVCKKRGVSLNVDHILKIDEERRKLIIEVDELRSERKEAAAKRDIEKGKVLKERLDKKEAALAVLNTEFEQELFKVPNLITKNVPIGDETKNKVIKVVGKPKQFGFQPKDHLDLGEALDILDVPRAAKVSGSRFAYLKNDGALLELALINFAVDKLTKAGFTLVIPPILIRSEITKGLGYWQEGGNENYYLVSDFTEGGLSSPLYLIGTSEHALVPMYSGEIINGKDLPKKLVGVSPCLRREAGAYGKDTRGIFRLHQFEKVEMVELVKPEDAEKEKNKMLQLAQNLVEELELPYRLVQLASEDLSFPSAETIDIETWIPSQGKYRETHSISTTTDFQARRLSIKYREGGKTNFVHILNGTAIAIQRMIIAILENHQQKDGTVKLPKALHAYMGKDTLQRT